MNDLLDILNGLQAALESPAALLLYSAAYIGLSGMAFYAAFCRCVIMSRETTQRSVMLAFWLVAVASAASIFAIMFWGYTPHLMSVLHLGAFVSVFITARKVWSHGQVPFAYVRPEARAQMERRRAS